MICDACGQHVPKERVPEMSRFSSPTGGRRRIYPTHRLEVGEQVDIPYMNEKQATSIRISVYATGKKLDRKFSTSRRLKPGFITVRRTA